jgi:hypothetical protein
MASPQFEVAARLDEGQIVRPLFRQRLEGGTGLVLAGPARAQEIGGHETGFKRTGDARRRLLVHWRRRVVNQQIPVAILAKA